MIKKRKHHSEEFKAKVALEALKEQKTIVQIAQENEVHPNQVIKWRKQLLEGAGQIFEDGRLKPKEREVSQDQLFQQIGQLQYELAWLKKKLGIRDS